MTDPTRNTTPETDLVARLRDMGFPHYHRVGREAADALEAQTARAEKAEAALRIVAAVLQAEQGRMGGEPFTGSWTIRAISWRGTVDDALDCADAALTAAPDTAQDADDSEEAFRHAEMRDRIYMIVSAHPERPDPWDTVDAICTALSASPATDPLIGTVRHSRDLTDEELRSFGVDVK